MVGDNRKFKLSPSCVTGEDYGYLDGDFTTNKGLEGYFQHGMVGVLIGVSSPFEQMFGTILYTQPERFHISAGASLPPSVVFRTFWTVQMNSSELREKGRKWQQRKPIRLLKNKR